MFTKAYINSKSYFEAFADQCTNNILPSRYFFSERRSGVADEGPVGEPPLQIAGHQLPQPEVGSHRVPLSSHDPGEANQQPSQKALMAEAVLAICANFTH